MQETNLVERDRQHLWHPYTQEKIAPLPIAIIRGEGVWLFTEDGRKILDGISSWWVNIHGHSHPVLNQALAEQANTLEHVMFAGFTHRPAVELAEKLKGIALEKGKSVYFRALPPKDRKVIHQYLAEDGRVKSRSIGEGHFKKIKIYPTQTSEGTSVEEHDSPDEAFGNR